MTITACFPPRLLEPSADARRIARAYQPFEPEPIRDRVGGWLIGYGHRIKRGERHWIAEDEASYILDLEVDAAARSVREILTDRVTQGCFDALVDWHLATDRTAVRYSKTFRLLSISSTGARKAFAVDELGTRATIMQERMRRVDELALWKETGSTDCVG